VVAAVADRLGERIAGRERWLHRIHPRLSSSLESRRPVHANSDTPRGRAA
jgi:hypothetical protein